MFEDIVKFIRDQYETNDFIPLHAPSFRGKEKQYVIDAIDSTYVSSVGKYVDQFEELIRNYTGAKYAIAVVNGTAALHMALLLAGVKKDDYVITQSLSFVATCNAIAYVEATPFFIDIDKHTLGLSYEKLKIFLREKTYQKNGYCFYKKDNRRISACVPMHTFGLPLEIDAVGYLCNEFNIALIEDAAESLGSTYKGKHTGTFGLMGTYSFNGNKTITCGGGGMIVTDNEKLGKSAKHLTTQAKLSHPWNFDHDQIGYNYRLPNLNAAMGCAQMEQLDLFIEKKRELAKRYHSFFRTQSITCLPEIENARSNYWLNAILLNDRNERDSFLEFTNQRGVMTRPSWTMLSKLEMFKHCPKEDLSNAQFIEDRLVNIPSSANITSKN